MRVRQYTMPESVAAKCWWTQATRALAASSALAGLGRTCKETGQCARGAGEDAVPAF